MRKSVSISGSSTSSLTSSTSIDSNASGSILGGLDQLNTDDFSLDSLFMEPENHQTPHQNHANMKSQNSENIVADSTFGGEMVPFVDWNHPMEWPQNSNFENPGNCLLNPGNSCQSQHSQDMRVLGVDLDMLTSTDPFYTSPTPPPSPDSSSTQNIGVSFKPHTMAFEVTSNKIMRGNGTMAHHMACHDYTNKVRYSCLIFQKNFYFGNCEI